MKIKVSVCIPVYGVEKYIERCARSLFEQTLQEIEFVFVDDCSPDLSIEILQDVLNEYPQRKEQVKIIRHETNRGLVAARNTALKYVSGEYVIHCDSDDWVEFDMYEVMYNKAKETDADMVYCDFVLEYSNKKSEFVQCAVYNDAETMLKESIYKSCSHLWSSMYKREIAENENIIAPDHICLNEDTLRILQMYCLAGKIAKCDGKSFFYHYFRGNANSYTNCYKKEFFFSSCDLIEILNKVLPAYCQKQIVILKGNTLFNAVKYDLLSGKKFKKLWRKDRKDILFCKNVSKIKRFILFIAFLNYHVAAKSCKLAWALYRKAITAAVQ